MKKFFVIAIALFIVMVSLESCNTGGKKDSTTTNEFALKLPDWAKSATIYEVNIRQYTEAGTFVAFAEHLPRLQEMGVDILWLMPIFPIGEIERKGSLGSYYAVKDYLTVNPEFGTMDDFIELVTQIHDMGMYVILDWVANHTAMDNDMVYSHPDWFNTDSVDQIAHPVDDWSDVADLNYESPEMREYMKYAMKSWVMDANIDGFRCDVASMVPTDFWNEVRVDLSEFKEVFMLAESEEPELLVDAFDMDYAWDLHHRMNEVAKGTQTVHAIDNYFSYPRKQYAADDIKMNFITNHDENSWNGTVAERMGDAAKVMAVLSATVPGMPLVYSGQEAGLNKRLKFFDKDQIDWKVDEMGELYTKLFKLKHENKALWNGEWGGEMKRINTSNDDAIFAFIREKDEHKVFVVLNLSASEQKFTFTEKCYCDKYTDIFSGKQFEIVDEIGMKLGAWEYSVCEKH